MTSHRIAAVIAGVLLGPALVLALLLALTRRPLLAPRCSIGVTDGTTTVVPMCQGGVLSLAVVVLLVVAAVLGTTAAAFVVRFRSRRRSGSLPVADGL